MYTYAWYHWITFFYIYCFFGWIFESIYVSLKKKQFVNRGFLRLPMLPLYGTGAVMMLWVSLPFKDNLVLVYCAGVAAATALEYVTGYLMELLFKVKYWDYSNQKFQINGYICLTSSIAWGFLTIFLTKIIHRPVADLVLSLAPATEFLLLTVVSIFFIADTIQSTKEALALGRALEAMTIMKTELDEMQLQLALLKAEASQKMGDIKSDARLKANEFKRETLQRIEDLKDETKQRTTTFKNETQQLANELINQAHQQTTDLKQETKQRMTAFKNETLQLANELINQTHQRTTDLKQETKQQVNELIQDIHQRTSEFKNEAKPQQSQTDNKTLQEHAATQIIVQTETKDDDRQFQTQEQIRLLTERSHYLKEKRRKLFLHISVYQKALLKRNPSAASKKFTEALRELQSFLEHR